MHARLLTARAVLWVVWEFLHITLVVLIRPEHPMRVFITGARKQMRPIQAESLRHGNGPRFCATTKLKFALVGLVPAALVLPPIWQLL